MCLVFVFVFCGGGVLFFFVVFLFCCCFLSSVGMLGVDTSLIVSVTSALVTSALFLELLICGNQSVAADVCVSVTTTVSSYS